MKSYFLLIIAIFSIFLSFAQTEITTKELRQHVDFLASDSLKGRKPGTPEAKIAADYIRKEFNQAGLTLEGENGFQYFEILDHIELGNGNHLYIDKFSAKAFEDNIPLAFSASKTVSANVVFAGYGFDIKTPKFTWNDYENIDVKNKWVLILRGTPEKNAPKFRSHSSDRAKAMTAAEKGAAGVLLVSGRNFDENDELIPFDTHAGNAQMKIPVIHIIRHLANRILKKSNTTVEDAEAEINTKFKPKSFQTKSNVKAVTKINYIKIKTQNVVGFLEGAAPNLKNEIIIIGAHYDHLGFGGRGSGSRMPDTLAVHNGADDNASGVAGVIELARKFASAQNKPARSILFTAYSAEEAGLLGSKYFTEHPLFDLSEIYCMINLDMIGRLDTDKAVINIAGTGTASEFNSLLDSYKDKTNIELRYSPSGFGASDHSSFYLKDIPVLFFNTGAHADYHTPFDDTEKINFKGMTDICNLIFDISSELANEKNALHFKESGDKKQSNSRTTYKVTLGIMPGYANSDNDGLHIDGVTKNKPAYRGGMKKGDIIIAIDGKKISNIYDYMEYLKTFKKGQIINVDIKRGNELKILRIQL